MVTGAQGTSDWRFPLTDVRIGKEAVDAVSAVLERGWLSSGPCVESFENAFARMLGAGSAVACASGTAAIELAYDAIGLAPGDEVIVPSLNFVAAANLAVRRGAVPVFADVVSEDDLTIDPEAVDLLSTQRTRAVVAMHHGGYPCRDELYDRAAARGIAVVEDAAHAPGGASARGACGTLGTVGCFSFYANKNLPLGEGGMLVCSDEEAARRARLLRSHGMTTTTWERHLTPGASYDVVTPGVNARIDEVRAALGIVLLRGLDDGNARRAEADRAYRELLAGVPGLSIPFAERPAGERPAHHLFCVLLDPEVDRERVRAALAARGVQTSVHYPPIHRMTAFQGSGAELPRTDAVAERLLTLPMHPYLDEDAVALIVDELRSAVSAPSGTR